MIILYENMEVVQNHVNYVMFPPRWKNRQGRTKIQQIAKSFGLRANMSTVKLLDELEYDCVSTDDEWKGVITELLDRYKICITIEERIETLDAMMFFVSNTPYKLAIHENIRIAFSQALDRNKDMYPNYDKYRMYVSDKKLV